MNVLDFILLITLAIGDLLAIPIWIWLCRHPARRLCRWCGKGFMWLTGASGLREELRALQRKYESHRAR